MSFSKTKYRNKITEVDGIRFHSKKEASHYLVLKTLEKAKKIWELELQVPFKIEVEGKKICTYRADFTYKDKKGFHVVDVKGVRTQIYSLKKKLIEALYPFTIEEV